MGEFIRLEQGDMTVAQHEARCIELSRFSPTTNCYKGGESVKVSEWVETLLKEQDIHSKAECGFRDGGQSSYSREGQ